MTEVEQIEKLIVVTTPTAADRVVVETIGIVSGNAIRARHIGKDILAALRAIVGGEIHEYAKLLAESREQAVDRMVSKAINLGANGIVNMRFSTSVVMGGAAEIMAYGTAVILERKS